MKTNQLLERYDNKYVRSLIQLVPFGIGSAIDTYLQETIYKMREDRLTTFFNQVNEINTKLNDDLITSENFIHNYFTTIRTVTNTRRKEKIELIGKLFNSAINVGIIDSEDDEYESKLKILDELTYTEIEILQILYELENTKTKETDKTFTLKNSEHHKQARLQLNHSIWAEFKQIMFERFNVESYHIDEVLIRIERTGCLYIPRISDENYRPYSAFTTETFKQLKELIME